MFLIPRDSISSPEKLPANKHFITRPKLWPHSSSSAVQNIPGDHCQELRAILLLSPPHPHCTRCWRGPGQQTPPCPPPPGRGYHCHCRKQPRRPGTDSNPLSRYYLCCLLLIELNNEHLPFYHKPSWEPALLTWMKDDHPGSEHSDASEEDYDEDESDGEQGGGENIIIILPLAWDDPRDLFEPQWRLRPGHVFVLLLTSLTKKHLRLRSV